MAGPATAYSLDAFRSGSLSASEYLESLYAREEILAKETKNKKRRRKTQPESAKNESKTVEDTIDTPVDRHPSELSAEPPLPVEVAFKDSPEAAGRVKAESSHQALDAMPLVQCSNCPTTATPSWGKDDVGNFMCNACGLYLKAHSSARPAQNDVVGERPRAPRQCSNCQTTSTTYWRKDDADNTLCNACGLYFKTRGRTRPISLQSKLSLRTDPAPMVQGQCSNCSTTAASVWRKDDADNTLCNACGLYLKACGRARPISLQSTRSRRRAAPRHPTTHSDSGSEPSVSDPEPPPQNRTSPDSATLKNDAKSEPDAADERSEKRRRVSRPAKKAYRPPRSELVKQSSPAASETGTTSTSREPTTNPPEVQQCAHCRSTRSSNRCWVKSKLGGTGKICNACAHYEKRNNRRRPFSLVQCARARGSK
ncbi:hypothetical protein C8R44DRAFT_691381 [Mycena epipterygia]|nr:hypothetical protein C8R44DRAFT_691381 [Mycena epipterygia]